MLPLLVGFLVGAHPDSACLADRAEHWLFAVAYAYHAAYADSTGMHLTEEWHGDSAVARFVTDPAVCRLVIEALFPGRPLVDSKDGAPSRAYVFEIGTRGYVALFPRVRAGEWQMTYFVDRKWRPSGFGLGI
jgi:hypothetical protein